MNKYKDPTEITIDRNGLAWRGGKILGRKPWIVATESSITLRDEMVIKAVTQEEAEEKAIEIANSRAKRLDKGGEPFTEVVACYCDS